MSDRAIVHEPAPEPACWMLEGVGRLRERTGTQVRVRDTGAGIEVGAFPGLDPPQVERLLAKLVWWLAWSENGINKPDCWLGLSAPTELLVMELPDDGESPIGPTGYATETSTVTAGELASVMFAYLDGRR